MAIKISNTTVIDDSRNLVNIGGLKTINGSNILGEGDILTGNVTLDGNQELTSKTISGGVFSGAVEITGAVRSSIVLVQALNIDCSLGNYFSKSISANSTFTFSSAPTGKLYNFVLELTHTSGAVTWPASVRWPGGVVPTLTAGKTHLFVFLTDDGGTSWRAAANLDYTN